VDRLARVSVRLLVEEAPHQIGLDGREVPALERRRKLMLKRRLNRFALTGLAAAALMLGSLAPSTSANANGMVGEMLPAWPDGMATMFELNTPPGLVGQDVLLLQGPAVGIGTPVRMVPLGWGATYVATPSAPGMVTTAVGAEFMVGAGTDGLLGEY